MNTEKIITDRSGSYLPAGLQNKLVFAPLAVFFIGVTVIFLTRYIFYIYHPAYFDGRVPSISKSAAFAPGSYLFCAGIIIVCACIFVTVSYVRVIYHERINRLTLDADENRQLLKLCNTGYLFAMLAGTFLLLLAIISLEDNDPLHIILSILFFATQNLAFVYDFVCTRKINRHLRKQIHNKAISPGRGRAILFVIITCLSLSYLFMFIFKDSAIFGNNYLSHQVYTTIEYTWATLAFLYAALYYPEVRNHMEQQLAEAGSQDRLEYR